MEHQDRARGAGGGYLDFLCAAHRSGCDGLEAVQAVHLLPDQALNAALGRVLLQIAGAAHAVLQRLRPPPKSRPRCMKASSIARLTDDERHLPVMQASSMQLCLSCIPGMDGWTETLASLRPTGGALVPEHSCDSHEWYV